MRRGAAFALLAAVLGVVGIARADAPAAAAKSAGPRLVVEPASFDFGRALSERKLSKDFILRNVGTRPLVIEKISTTCGCTVADLAEKDRTLAPGASVPLHVVLHTQTVPAPNTVVKKSVLLRTNEGADAITAIELTATVSDAKR